MASIFNINSPMMRMLSNLWDWIVLNLLTVLFSLPIITVGAATTAMYYCVGKQRRGEDSVVKDFWHSFKANFWPATGMWLIFVVAVWILGMSIFSCIQNPSPGFKVIGCISGCVTLLFVAVASWSFALLSRFENTIRETITNAIICVLTNFWRSLMIALVNLLPLLLFFLLGPQIVIYLATIWYAMAANYNMWLIRKPFKHLEESSEYHHAPN